MLRNSTGPYDHGFPQDKWEAAKAEAKTVLAQCARQRQMIPYSDFVKKIHSIHIKHHDPRQRRFAPPSRARYAKRWVAKPQSA